MLIEKRSFKEDQNIEISQSRYKPKKRIHQRSLLADGNIHDLQAIFGDFVICYKLSIRSKDRKRNI